MPLACHGVTRSRVFWGHPFVISSIPACSPSALLLLYPLIYYDLRKELSQQTFSFFSLLSRDVTMSTHGYIADPPEGVARDVDGQTLVQQRIIVDSSITLSIALFILACRLYSRLFITRSFGLDDCMTFCLQLCALRLGHGVI